MATPTIREVVVDPPGAGAAQTVSVTTGAGTAVGDWLIAVHQIGFRPIGDLATPAATQGAWTSIVQTPALSGGSSTIGMRAWRRRVTSAGAQTVTITAGEASTDTNALMVFVIVGADDTSPIDGTPVTNVGTSGTQSVGPVTTTTTDALLITAFGGYGNGSDYTGVSGAATVTNGYGETKLSSNNGSMIAAQALTAAGSTGTRSAVMAATSNDGWAGVMFAVNGPLVTPIAVTDSGPGVDTPTVGKTEIRDLVEAAPSADSATTLADHDALTDSGASSETIVIEQLTSISISDAGGVGADTVAVADFIGNDLVETAPGVDTISLVRTNFVDLTDSGPGVDTTTLLQELNVVADSGAGSDVLTGLAVPQLSDSGVGVDEISIVVIPFTALLPLIEGTIYDLVVVARVPQASGPPTFIEVDPIEWKSLTYSNTLKEPQDLSASCLISSVPESIWQRLRALHELATELWLYRNGERVFAGPLQGWQTSGEDLQLSCKGLLQYLRSMVVHTNQVFANVDQNIIVKTLVDQWQNLSYGHFGIDTSLIVPSGNLRTTTYLRDELHVVGTRVEELGKLATGFDAEVDPATRELLLWSPTKGVDRSVGEDAIVFDARNITSGDILCSVAGGDLASEAYGNAGSAGSDGALFAMRSNDELRARYGRTGVTGSFSNEQSQTALNDYVQGLLDARAQVLLVPGPRCRVTPDADLSAYAVGDLISYDLAEQLGINQAFRIRKQTVTVSSTGQESVNLEFV